MSTSQLYPVLDFSSIDYTKIQENAFLIGLDVKNNKLLSKVDNTGKIIAIEKDGSDGGGGRDGIDGKSAYEIWKSLGNIGTEQDFLNSLKGLKGESGETGEKGEPGEIGPTGETGASAYDIWISLGHSGTEAHFLDTLRGAKGDTGLAGPKGDTGASAYETWLANGNAGTESDFLNALKGDTGLTGETGLSGKSTYEIWLANGNVGTEEQFLRSLVGAGATFVDRELPIGEIDGINTRFELINLPVENSEYIYINGLLQESGLDYDYTISGKVITFNNPPIVGMKLRCSYRGISGLNFIDKENPVGQVNGINRTFELANPLVRRSEHIYLNGLLQEEGINGDYTIEGKTVTFNDPPLTGMKITCSYRSV